MNTNGQPKEKDTQDRNEDVTVNKDNKKNDEELRRDLAVKEFLRCLESGLYGF